MTKRRVTESDRRDFAAFLKNCTLSQVRAVFEKERAAGRRVYQRLAENELRDRGVQP